MFTKLKEVFVIRRLKGDQKTSTRVCIAYLINAYQVEVATGEQSEGALFNAKSIAMWINNFLEKHKKDVPIQSVTPEQVAETLKMLSTNNLFIWVKRQYEELQSKEL